MRGHVQDFWRTSPWSSAPTALHSDSMRRRYRRCPLGWQAVQLLAPWVRRPETRHCGSPSG